MISIKVLQANNSNIDEWSNLNYRLFNLVDARSQNMVRKRYYSALDAIKFVELYASGEKVGHVSCIRQRMYIGSVLSDVTFPHYCICVPSLVVMSQCSLVLRIQ